MTALGFLRAEDQLPPQATAPDGMLDPTPLIGNWVADDRMTAGIVRLELRHRDGALYVRTFGATGVDPYDWGEIEATPFGSGVLATTAVAFTAVYDFGFLIAILAGYTRQEGLVVDTFNTFVDGSGRSAYFTSEVLRR